MIKLCNIVSILIQFSKVCKSAWSENKCTRAKQNKGKYTCTFNVPCDFGNLNIKELIIT